MLLFVGVVAVGLVVATADAGELTCTLEHTNYTFDNPWPLADQEAHGDSYPGDGWVTAGQHEVTEVEYHEEIYSGFSEDEHDGCDVIET